MKNKGTEEDRKGNEHVRQKERNMGDLKELKLKKIKELRKGNEYVGKKAMKKEGMNELKERRLKEINEREDEQERKLNEHVSKTEMTMEAGRREGVMERK